MKKTWKSLGRLLRRRPRVTLVVCPSCSQQMAARTTQSALRDLSAVDELRQDLAGDDQVKNRFLTDIEKRYVRGVNDVQRRAFTPDVGDF